jgi:hypothetical protein
MDLLMCALAFASVVVGQTAAVIAVRNLSSHGDFDGGHRTRGARYARSMIALSGESGKLRRRHLAQCDAIAAPSNLRAV